MGIMSLAGWARERIDGLNFTLYDQHIEYTDYDQVADTIIRQRPEIVGLSYMTRAAAFIPAMTRKIKAALPDTFIMLGGPHPSAAEEHGLRETAADALVIGEGEISFAMLVERLRDKAPLEDVPGLVHRTSAGEVIKNPGTTPEIDDLDTIPFFPYELIDLPRYWNSRAQSLMPPPRKYVTLFTSRGCPYRCIYCHDVFGKTFRAQSADRILAEIQYLQRTYGIEFVDFMDDIFNLDKKRVIDFGQSVTGANVKIKITMGNGVRTDILTQPVVDAMCDAGLIVCGFALESGSRRIQKLIKKNLNIDKFLVGVEMMARKRVFTYGMNMFGFPTETSEEMQLTIDTATNSMLHQAFFFKATPYPKTALYDAAMEHVPDRMKELNYANHDYQFEGVVNLSEVSDEELQNYARRAMVTFYSKPVRIARFLRDYPMPLRLVHYVPGAFNMAFSKTRGLFQKNSHLAPELRGEGTA